MLTPVPALAEGLEPTALQLAPPLSDRLAASVPGDGPRQRLAILHFLLFPPCVMIY